MTDASFADFDRPVPQPVGVNRVPDVTPGFWLIKLMAVTMGETAADFLAVNLGFGLGATTVLMTAVLIVAMLWQFRQKAYVPAYYWITVVLISVVGTLITDNMTDALGIPLIISTIGFTLALGITFAVWFAVERTLSIHEVCTFRREAVYWVAVLLACAGGRAGVMPPPRGRVRPRRHRGLRGCAHHTCQRQPACCHGTPTCHVPAPRSRCSSARLRTEGACS
jgi:hypothetical protein